MTGTFITRRTHVCQGCHDNQSRLARAHDALEQCRAQFSTMYSNNNILCAHYKKLIRKFILAENENLS